MINKYFFKAFFVAVSMLLFSCGSDESVEYAELPPVSPVVFNINAVPYPKLSDYNFFEGEMKDLKPVYGVIPYDLNSELFTDYAEKKRFIWMPAGVKATYMADVENLNFPTGTILIKNFYYTTLLPGNTTSIIETRLMIKKDAGWIFANYVWNAGQTEATLQPNGGYAHLSFDHNGTTINTNYVIPPHGQCVACHKFGGQNISLGVKPQNLNKLYQYPEGTKNQLAKLIEAGYLNNTGIPQNIVSTVDWKDTSKSFELRVRSYLDINCAHCHSEGTSCDYTPMRLAFSETHIPANLGVCVQPLDFAPNGETHLIARGSVERSLIHSRLNTTVQAEMMPMVGRTVIHQEGVQLMKDWINSMETPCP
jgi:uncharacterized repeat protein (TIGR03806 family)